MTATQQSKTTSAARSPTEQQRVGTAVAEYPVTQPTTRRDAQLLDRIVGGAWLIEQSLDRYQAEGGLDPTLQVVVAEVTAICAAMEAYSERTQSALCSLEHLDVPFRRRKSVRFLVLGRFAHLLGLTTAVEVSKSQALVRLAAALDVSDIASADDVRARWFAHGKTLHDLAVTTRRIAQQALGERLSRDEAPPRYAGQRSNQP